MRKVEKGGLGKKEEKVWETEVGQYGDSLRGELGKNDGTRRVAPAVI